MKTTLNEIGKEYLDDPQVERKPFVLQVKFGKVTKFDLRKQLGCMTDYEWRKTISHLRKDQQFNTLYTAHFRTWGLPEVIAIKIIKHLMPGHKIIVEVASNP